MADEKGKEEKYGNEDNPEALLQIKICSGLFYVLIFSREIPVISKKTIRQVKLSRSD